MGKSVSSVPDCPSCGTRGQVQSGRLFLKLLCPKCAVEWQTLSEVCPICGEHNNYPVEGPCKKCYESKVKAG